MVQFVIAKLLRRGVSKIKYSSGVCFWASAVAYDITGQTVDVSYLRPRIIDGRTKEPSRERIGL